MHNYKIEYKTNAKAKIQADALYYNMKQKGLGLEYLEKIEKKINLITKHPKIAPIIYDIYRKIPLEKFEHSIIYTINEPQNQIIIAAVQHHKQHPENWRRELVNYEL